MASWNPLNNQPTFNAETMLLLTDGTVMCHESGSSNWHRLTPDSTGNYQNGTWSSLAPLPNNPVIPASGGGPTNAPTYFASAVLSDGRAFTAGGEDNNGVSEAEILATQIYDPTTNAWTNISPPPGFTQLGDAPCCVLADGRLIIGSSLFSSVATAILDPVTQIWEPGGNKADSPSEETWTLLPNNNVLTVECSNSPAAEQYNPTTNTWITAGSTPSNLTQPCTGDVPEIGPAILLPYGTVFAIGASGATAVYTPNANATVAGTWSAGPNLVDSHGNGISAMDAPASLLPSGKVLLAASPLLNNCTYPSPTTFVLYDPVANTATAVTGPSNTNYPCYAGRMLLLPTGQVLFTYGSTDVEIYTPDGSPQAAWAPAITDAPGRMIIGHTYTISGTQLNGLSQACSYGDDAQMATNYPIFRLTNGSGDVVYLRSATFSTMGVATGSTVVTADVTSTSNATPGNWNLEAVANGIVSSSVPVVIASQDCFIVIERSTFGAGEIEALIEVSGEPVTISPTLYVVVEGFTQTEIGSVLPNIPSPLPKISFPSAGPAVPEDPTLPPSAVQRFTFPFSIQFADDSPFGSTDQTLAITATFTSTDGITVSNTGEIELLATPDPFISHGPTAASWYLSVDLCVFQLSAGQSAFGTPVGTTGPVGDNANSFIATALSNLNTSPATFGPEFDTRSQPGQDAIVNLAPTDSSHTAVYNFAFARVRCQDVNPANNVRVFFRLWQAQQTNATYDTSTFYRSYTSGTQKIPLLGIEGDEIVTIPFFAAQRIDSTTASMTTQTDPLNVVPTIAPGAGGALVDTYYGCWLDVNQPSQNIFPPWMAGVPAIDGPYNQPLVSIQQLVRATHQCLIAEIAYDPDPIPANEDPSTSDKLAQRNLAFINIPNPGIADSRIAPQTFVVKPSRATLLADGRPDEMMIDWGRTPSGSVASFYLPGTTSAAILDWADKLYTTHKLTRVDPYTVSCPTGGFAYIPIPQSSSGLNFMGLMSIAFPATVHKGDQYDITIRQLTSVVVGGDRNRIAGSADFVNVDENCFAWRRVAGIFQITIPVSTKQELMVPEENTLAILRWIQQAIPVASRWYPVFLRYVSQIAGRVDGLGGNSCQIEPSGSGFLPVIVPPSGGKIEFRGKIKALIYNHFGDFEAFVLETGCGKERRFESCEPKVECIMQRLMAECQTVTIAVGVDRPDCPESIIVNGCGCKCKC